MSYKMYSKIGFIRQVFVKEPLSYISYSYFYEKYPYIACMLAIEGYKMLCDLYGFEVVRCELPKSILKTIDSLFRFEGLFLKKGINAEEILNELDNCISKLHKKYPEIGSEVFLKY